MRDALLQTTDTCLFNFSITSDDQLGLLEAWSLALVVIRILWALLL